MSITQIEVDQVASHLPELIEEVSGGVEVVITKNDQPIAKLVRYRGARRTPKFGSAKGLITIADDFDEPLPEFEEYTR